MKLEELDVWEEMKEFLTNEQTKRILSLSALLNAPIKGTKIGNKEKFLDMLGMMSKYEKITQADISKIINEWSDAYDKENNIGYEAKNDDIEEDQIQETRSNYNRDEELDLTRDDDSDNQQPQINVVTQEDAIEVDAHEQSQQEKANQVQENMEIDTLKDKPGGGQISLDQQQPTSKQVQKVRQVVSVELIESNSGSNGSDSDDMTPRGIFGSNKQQQKRKPDIPSVLDQQKR